MQIAENEDDSSNNNQAPSQSISPELAQLRNENADLKSTLTNFQAGAAEGNQRILTLQSASEIAQQEAKTLKAKYETEVGRLQRENTDLQSALVSLQAVVAEGKQTLSQKVSGHPPRLSDHNVHFILYQDDEIARANAALETRLVRSLPTQKARTAEGKWRSATLQPTLNAARDEVKTLNADYDPEVTRLQRERSDLQSALGSALGTLKNEVRGKQGLSKSTEDFRQWKRENSVVADALVSDLDQSASSGDCHHVLANNALIEIHSENWSSAYEQADKSLAIHPSTIGYIAKSLAQIGNGKQEEAIQIFDLAFGTCDSNENNLLLLIKAIVLFVARKYDTAISRINDLISVSKDDEATYCYIQVLGKMYLMQGDYTRGVQTLERAQTLASSGTGSDLEDISIGKIFGWTFDGLQITVQRYHCEDLYASGRAEEAAEALRKMLDAFGEEIHANKATMEWVTELKGNCINTLVELGDTALSSGEHETAIRQYSAALSLDPSNAIDILVKRSKARACKKSWEDALTDANEVIQRDPSSHLGYERQFAALHGAENYGEANNALLRMLSIMENSPDEEIRRLRSNYTTPRETIAVIDAAVHEFFRFCPLVLIDVTTGRLCDAEERVRVFKSEVPFKKLISEAAVAKIDRRHIRQSVAIYFKWTMFSHTWEGKEPTFQEVNVVDSVWKLDKTPLTEKLCQFCTIAREGGGRWVWSDTCCIDKSTSTILSQSLTAMYTWYAEAAETLVYLADVLSSAELGALTKSRWMTRAWTLQELLASKVIRFHTCDWKLYLNDTHANHKESPAIKQELALAIGVSPETITRFQPENLRVREKLRLASKRNATVEEDIAYSLIGIFSSDIAPRYGLGNTALGQLLESIVARTGDVTVIAWSGSSLPYNSALPDSLAVYNKVPYTAPLMNADELDESVEQLRTALAPHDALTFYYKVLRFPRASFSNRCLQLPCIVFSVTKIGVQELCSEGNLYRATVSLLGNVEFRTVDPMPLKRPRKLVFIHPWFHDIRDPLDGFVSDEENESDTGSSNQGEEEREGEGGSNIGSSTGDVSRPASPLPADPSARVDPTTQALRFIVRLGRPFNALLLEQQSNGQYKRVATESEIIVSGVPSQTNPKDIRAKSLEII